MGIGPIMDAAATELFIIQFIQVLVAGCMGGLVGFGLMQWKRRFDRRKMTGQDIHLTDEERLGLYAVLLAVRNETSSLSVLDGPWVGTLALKVRTYQGEVLDAADTAARLIVAARKYDWTKMMSPSMDDLRWVLVPQNTPERLSSFT